VSIFATFTIAMYGIIFRVLLGRIFVSSITSTLET